MDPSRRIPTSRIPTANLEKITQNLNEIKDTDIKGSLGGRVVSLYNKVINSINNLIHIIKTGKSILPAAAEEINGEVFALSKQLSAIKTRSSDAPIGEIQDDVMVRQAVQSRLDEIYKVMDLVITKGKGQTVSQMQQFGPTLLELGKLNEANRTAIDQELNLLHERASDKVGQIKLAFNDLKNLLAQLPKPAGDIAAKNVALIGLEEVSQSNEMTEARASQIRKDIQTLESYFNDSGQTITPEIREKINALKELVK